MRINTENTAALVIDYQKKLVPVMDQKLEFVHQSVLLLRGLMALAVPVLVTQQNTEGLGETIPEIHTISGIPAAYEKQTFSCLGNEDLYAALDAMNVENVLVCGCEAHICVLQTVLDLLAEKYNVFLVRDCIASRHAQDLDAAVSRAEKEGAMLTTAEAALYELLETAENPCFPQILSLVKG